MVLLLDVAPGPTVAAGVTFGVALSPALQIVPLAPDGPIASFAPTVPNLPVLDGAVVYAEAVELAPLEPSGAVAISLSPPPDLPAVDDFTYRLQGSGGTDLTLQDIQGSAFDLCVVDFSRDGLVEFTPAEIAALKSPAEPDRIRLAYMSIGEAEDYRFYFPNISPSLLAGSNPQWPGNYKVTYWEPEWKEVIIHGNAAIGKSYLDRVIDQGFDGVYLDIIDAFEFFGPQEAGGSDWKRDAAREMVEFVLEIAYHARITRGRPDFLVVQQNGANILEAEWYPPDTLAPGDPPTPEAMAAWLRPRLFDTVCAIGVEDVFFFGSKDENNAYNPQTYVLNLLDQWQAHGIPVLSIEYLTQQAKIDAFYDVHAKIEGFIPYATVRDLDEMTVNPGHEPD